LTQELGAKLVQLLPCVEPKDSCTTAPGHWDSTLMPMLGSSAARPGNLDSVVTEWSVDPDDWGEFLCHTFDIWYQNDLGKVVVNLFESWVAQWMGQPATLCILDEVCGRALAIENAMASRAMGHNAALFAGPIRVFLECPRKVSAFPFG